MGLFHRETYHCGICGTEVNKAATQVSDGSRLCHRCDNNVRSAYVDRNVRLREYNGSSYYYKDIDLKQMQQLQDFFAEARNRAKNFVPTYFLENFCIDKDHGWFFIDQDAIAYRKKLNSYKPLEIYSVDDIYKLQYRFQLGDVSKYGYIDFQFNTKLLPYYATNCITFHSKLFEFEDKFKKRVVDNFSEVCQFFPGIAHITPEGSTRLEIEAYYSGIKAEIDDLALKRVALNNQVDSLMSDNLPDKYRKIARQYLELDNLISSDIELLRDPSSFSSAREMKECKEGAVSCLAQMLTIYMNLQKNLD